MVELALKSRSMPCPPTTSSPVASNGASESTPDLSEMTRALNRHIERVEQTLAAAVEKAEDLAVERDAARAAAREMERERDAAQEQERALAAQVESLRALMASEARIAEMERDAARQAKADRDQWRALAARPWWKRLVG